MEGSKQEVIIDLTQGKTHCKVGDESNPTAAQGATGLRTAAGRRRSSRNAIKDSIFSAVVPDGEDQRLYRTLLRGLEESLRPVGMSESLQVEMLAINTWRLRRLWQVESAEIQQNIQLQEAELSDRACDHKLRFDRYKAETDREGLIGKVSQSPDAAEYCLNLLLGVRLELPGFEFDGDHHWIPLGRVYGARYEGRPGKDLFDFYLYCRKVARLPDGERKKRGFTSEQDCLEKFSVELDQQIRYVEGFCKKSDAKQRISRRRKKPDLSLLTCRIPDAPKLDLLIRYEATLERAIDRNLSQLERLQRMRLGQLRAGLGEIEKKRRNLE